MVRKILLSVMLCVALVGCTVAQKKKVGNALETGSKIVNVLNTIAKGVAGNRELIEDRFGDEGEDVADSADDIAVGTGILSALLLVLRNIVNKKNGG